MFVPCILVRVRTLQDALWLRPGHISCPTHLQRHSAFVPSHFTPFPSSLRFHVVVVSYCLVSPSLASVNLAFAPSFAKQSCRDLGGRLRGGPPNELAARSTLECVAGGLVIWWRGLSGRCLLEPGAPPSTGVSAAFHDALALCARALSVRSAPFLFPPVCDNGAREETPHCVVSVAAAFAEAACHAVPFSL